MSNLTPFSQPVFGITQFSTVSHEPLLTVSEFTYAPTALDVTQLFPSGSSADQTTVLANTIARASSWADQFTMGQNGTLSASINIESGWLRPRNGYFNFLTDYRPVLQVLAAGIGFDANNVQSLTSDAAALITIDGKLVKLPACWSPGVTSGLRWASNADGRWLVILEYITGYPHSTLAADAAQGDTALTISNTLGCTTGTQLTIYDSDQTETITVTAVTSSTALATTALAYPHTVPAVPDGISVSALPAAVKEAVILLTGALIKARGDGAVVMNSYTGEPSVKAGPDLLGDKDVAMAKEMLEPFRVVTKLKS